MLSKYKFKSNSRAYGLYGGMVLESYNNAFGVGMTVGVAAAFGL